MMNAKAKRDIALKTKILNYANNTKNVAKTCRYFSIRGMRANGTKTYVSEVTV